MKRARAEGIHTVIETYGFCPWEHLQSLLPLVDMFYYDYKETNPALQKKYTGVDNHRILSNLRPLCAVGATIRLRCPIIPGVNAREEHFAGIAKLCKELPPIESAEVMPYHPLGQGKISRLGGEATGKEDARAVQTPAKDI